jgi:TetR/AcrR family transcriptional repressor of mexJK operon
MPPRKSGQIVETARNLFLERGYDGTSVDDVAAASGVSKTTVYNNFDDKEALFQAVILDVADRASAIADGLTATLGAEAPAADRLIEAAEQLAVGVLNPVVVQLRRLAIAEALRFPSLVQSYWDKAPGRAIDVLEQGLAAMDEAGELDIPDPREAAEQFAYAVLGPLQDQALLRPDQPLTVSTVAAHARNAAGRFTRAYARCPSEG